MARDQERGARIRALYAETKAQRPETTWRQIADAVGVSERAAAAWQKTGGINYENAKKLAAFFKGLGHDVDVDYIWRGPESDVPDLMGTINGDRSQLDQITEALAESNRKLDAIVAYLGLAAEEPVTLQDQIAQSFRETAASVQSRRPARTKPA